MKTQHRFKQWTLGLAVFSMAWTLGISSAQGQSVTYTLDADFDFGTLVNVNHDAPNNDQLQLNATTTPFPFVNIACSARGTVVRIDVNTCQVVGEYRSAPDGRGKNPSRTTVDQLGNVWVANRAESGVSGGVPKGSITRIGLIIGGTRVNADGTPNPVGQYLAPPYQYNTCIDRDGDGLIKTSLGLGNFLPWTNAGGADTHGGVSTADDECIITYTRVTGTGTRTVAIDSNNDVWVGGLSNREHEMVDGVTGLPVLGTQFNVGCGGYGGFVDGNDVLWSARDLVRAPTNPLTPVCIGDGSVAGGTWRGNYGLGLDPNTGNIWYSSLGGTNRVYELNPANGAILNSYAQGAAEPNPAFGAQGVTVDGNSHVWVAEIFGSHVAHYAPDPSNPGMHYWVGNVAGFTGTTGVAVDTNGKIWASEITGNSVSRIDPLAGAGPDFAGNFVGAIDCTTSVGAGAGPYNYSDMTGFVLLAAIQQGTWNVVYDSGTLGNTGCTISWNNEPEGAEPAGTSITVDARAADLEANLPAQLFVAVLNGSAPAITGQFIEVRATLDRDPGVAPVTPVLSDLTIECCVPLEDPDVRTQGFWKRVCARPHPSGEHENLPGYVDCVSSAATFAEVGSVNDLCDRLHPSPPNDKCEQAEAQFMALLLNVCSGRVATCNCIDDPDLGETTVGEAIAFIDALLSNPDRTFDDCVLAQAIADDINNGVSLVDCP